MSDGYTKLNLEDVDDAAVANGLSDRWQARVAREPLDAEQTGVTHFRLPPGGRSPFCHRHTEAEEIYVILGGSGRARLDGRFVDVGPLDALRIAPSVARAFEAGDDGLEFLAVGRHVPGDGQPVDDPWVSFQ
jgi:uncharacterized cupin superfamily protein